MKSKILIAFCLAAFLAACATAPRAPLQTVEERAQARWDLMLGKQYGEAWEYYTPGYRETVERDVFAQNLGQRPVRWLEAAVQGADCEEEDRCTVRAQIRYDVPSARYGMDQMVNTRTIQETWIRVGGEWWYVSNI